MRRGSRIVAAAVLVTAAAFGLQLSASVPTVDEIVPVLPTLPPPSADAAQAPESVQPPAGGDQAPAPTTRRPRAPQVGGVTSPRTRTTRPRLPDDGIVPLIRDGAPAPTKGRDGAPSVVAAAETELFPGQSGDEADDSAVWRNPADPARSFVLADNKAESGGVGVYDLRGRLVHYAAIGKIGNIDLRSGVPLGGRKVTLVGANDRADDSMRFWALDPTRGSLVPVAARALRTVAPNYGFCLGRNADGSRTYAFVSGEKSGTFEQYELRLGSGRVDAVKVRTLVLGSLSEGCVVDDAGSFLYIAEEDVGIWRYPLDPRSGAARTSVDRVGAGRLAADVEGLAAARGADGRGVLVASSQGDSTYSVYDLDGGNAYRGTFTVRSGPTVDGTTDTDGLALGSGYFGPSFPNGLLVVHDAENQDRSGESERGSNLKFARFDQVFALARSR